MSYNKDCGFLELFLDRFLNNQSERASMLAVDSSNKIILHWFRRSKHLATQISCFSPKLRKFAFSSTFPSSPPGKFRTNSSISTNVNTWNISASDLHSFQGSIAKRSVPLKMTVVVGWLRTVFSSKRVILPWNRISPRQVEEFQRRFPSYRTFIGT